MAEGAVALYFSRLGTPLYAHEQRALITVATAIAKIKGWDFTGSYQEERRRFEHMFFVPDDTLMLDEALGLGIHGPDDFFGGVVPYPFVKSKAISHPLIDNATGGLVSGIRRRSTERRFAGVHCLQCQRCASCGGAVVVPRSDPGEKAAGRRRQGSADHCQRS